MLYHQGAWWTTLLHGLAKQSFPSFGRGIRGRMFALFVRSLPEEQLHEAWFLAKASDFLFTPSPSFLILSQNMSVLIVDGGLPPSHNFALTSVMAKIVIFERKIADI